MGMRISCDWMASQSSLRNAGVQHASAAVRSAQYSCVRALAHQPTAINTRYTTLSLCTYEPRFTRDFSLFGQYSREHTKSITHAHVTSAIETIRKPVRLGCASQCSTSTQASPTCDNYLPLSFFFFQKNKKKTKKKQKISIRKKANKNVRPLSVKVFLLLSQYALENASITRLITYVVRDGTYYGPTATTGTHSLVLRQANETLKSICAVLPGTTDLHIAQIQRRRKERPLIIRPLLQIVVAKEGRQHDRLDR
jgi:hypothetical protein